MHVVGVPKGREVVLLTADVDQHEPAMKRIVACIYFGLAVYTEQMTRRSVAHPEGWRVQALGNPGNPQCGLASCKRKVPLPAPRNAGRDERKSVGLQRLAR